MFSKLKKIYIKQGYVLISNQNKKEFETFIENIGYTMKTSYSSNSIPNDFWYIDGKSNSSISSDLAYSNVGLKPHTDGTYMTEPPAVIAFNCIKNSEKGGETLLIDSFEIKEKLQPTIIELFSNTQYRWKNSSTKYNFQNYAPIIYKDIFRFNEYDLDDNQQADQYIKGINNVISQCKNIKIKLKENESLIINNHRILHGRTSFNGERIMYGCYIDRNVMNTFLYTRL